MSERIAQKVLFIGWDAADWRVINPLMDAGKLPNLQRLVERGVMGNITTLHPVLSPMLWTTIATGKRPYKHGILGFAEPTPDGAGVRPISSLSRKTKALWNILHQNRLKSNVVGWWPSAPVEPIDGVMVSNHYQSAAKPLDEPWPLRPGTVHPARLQEILKELRFHPSELGQEQVFPFVPKAGEIDQDEDRRLASVMKILAECVSIHSASTWLMENEAWDLMAVYHDAIDHFGHGFMRYHPPRQSFVSAGDFDIYSGVIEACYRFHDMMLGALVQLAGEETHILLCSDHGFHPDHNRPADIPDEPAGPAVEHRDVGIFVMAGPGVRRDELVHGASLLDITPTILTLLGLPLGADMDGKPLVQAFDSPPEVETIPSWDAVEGDAAMHAADIQSDPLAAQEAINQLVELGYIERLDDDREKAVAQTTRELRFNLARAYMDGDLHGEAVPILKQLYDDFPDQHRFGLQLALCYRALSRIDPLRALIEILHDRRVEQAKEAREKLTELNQTIEQRKTESDDKDAKLADLLSEDEQKEYRSLRGRARIRAYDVQYLRGYVAAAEGDHAGALEHLLEAEKAEPRRPGLHLQIGEAYLQLKRWADAERAFEKGMKIDPENAHVHLGLARSHLKRRRAKRAAEAAVKSVSLLYHYPMAHFVLGQALAQLRRYEQAVEAFEVAVALNPNFEEAHRRLAQIYGRRLGQPEEAEEHRDLARAIARFGRLNPADASEDEPMQPEAAPPVAEPHLTTLSATPNGDQSFITVVTGLPRSGTSMMMQMLDAGGVPILTDGKRSADENNRRGYYELEDATRLRTDNSWLGEAVGKGVKIVVQLLPRLSANYRYRIIFMQRDLEEVLASQVVMLRRLGSESAAPETERLGSAFEHQIQHAKKWLARCGLAVLFVEYGAVIDDPEGTAAALKNFVGGDLDERAMAGAVARDLYRQRRTNTADPSASSAAPGARQ